MSYEIETNVPLPVDPESIPVTAMKIGDSIQFPLNKRGYIQSVASKLKRDGKGVFKVKKVDDNSVRIWRIQ